MAHSKGSKLKLQKAERIPKSLELRKQGLTYKEIGDKLGVHAQTAYKDVMESLKVLADQTRDHAEQWRQLQLERIDAIFLVAFKHATSKRKPSLRAAETCIKLMERRAKLLGLDAPKLVENTNREVSDWPELLEIAAEAEQQEESESGAGSTDAD